MAAPDWIIRRGFPESLRGAAAELYFDAFSGKLGGLLGRDGRGIAFFERILAPEFSLCAVTRSEDRLLGIAGFKTAGGALTGGSWSDIVAIYGFLGAAWRAPLLSLLERDRTDDELLMDGIAVAGDARGLGIGSALLHAIVDEARARRLEAVRLDVIDSNPRARSLYERFGFEAVSKENIGFLRHIFGFSSASRMRLEVGGRPADTANAG